MYVHTRSARRAKRQAPRHPPSSRAAAAKKAVRQNSLLRFWRRKRDSGIRTANADPSLAGSVGRNAKNVPLARFLRVSTSSVRIPLPPGKNNHALSGVMIFSGGGRGIRTLVTWITGKTVFETAAFNHSAIPPYSIVRAQTSHF